MRFGKSLYTFSFSGKICLRCTLRVSLKSRVQSSFSVVREICLQSELFRNMLNCRSTLISDDHSMLLYFQNSQPLEQIQTQSDVITVDAASGKLVTDQHSVIFG